MSSVDDKDTNSTQPRHPDVNAQLIPVLESMSDAFYTLDRAWRFTYVNARMTRLYGRDKTELLGQLMWDVFPTVVGTKIQQALLLAMQEQRQVTFTESSSVLHRWIEGRVYPSVSGLAVYLRDVHGEREDAATIEQQASLLEQAHDAIFVWEFGNVIQQWYRGAEELYGWPRADAIGQNAQQLLHTAAPVPWASIEAALTQKSRWEGELVHTTRDGRRIIVESRMALITDLDGHQCVMEVNRDITQRRRMETQTAQLQAFTAALARTITRDDVARAIDRNGLAIFGESIVRVYLLSQDDKALERLTGHGMPPEWDKPYNRIPLDAPLLLPDAIRTSEQIWLATPEAYRERYPNAYNVLTPSQAIAALPLVIGGRTIAAMSISFPTPQSFNDEQRAAILTVAQHCAQALDRARLYEEAQTARRRAEQLADRTMRLQQVTGRLSEVLTPTEVTQVVVDQGVAALGASAGNVFLLDADRVNLELAGAIGYSSEMLRPWHRFPVNRLLPLTEVIHTGEALWLENLDNFLAKFPLASGIPGLAPGARAAIPLVIKGEIVGVIGLTFAQDRTFSEEDQQFTLTLAHQCEQTLERARLFEAEQQARLAAEAAQRRLSILARVSKSLAEHNRDLQSLFDTITEQLATLVGESCALRVVSDDGEWMQTRSIYHADPETLRLMRSLAAAPRRIDQGLFKQLMETQELIRIPVMTEAQYVASTPPEMHQHFERVGARSTILAPLQVADHVVGILTLSRLSPGKPYTEDDERLVQALASRAALAIENAQLYLAAQMNATTLQQQVAERTRELQAALERAQQTDRLKTVMIANVTHEMLTPMNSIIGFSDLILTRELDKAKIRHHTEIINSEARRLSRLINDFLDLQAITQNRQKLRLSKDNIGPLLENIIEQHEQDQPGTSTAHPLHLNLSPVPDVVMDRERIQQVITNLISNAVKYSPAGGPITVTLRQQESEIVVSVQDCGLGVPPEELGRLFEQFYRGDAAETLRIKGTGLGLTLCRQIIDAHHGRIWAESAGAGQGSTFSFALPIQADSTTH